jgi:hypothetical protein
VQRTRRQRIKPAVGANSRHERPQTMSCPRSGVYLGEHGPCLQPLKSAPNVAASPRRLQCPLYNTLCPQLLGGKRAHSVALDTTNASYLGVPAPVRLGQTTSVVLAYQEFHVKRRRGALTR